MQMSKIEKNTYTVPVMIDRTEYTSKPEGSLVGRIKSSMEKNGVVYMTMREVYDALISGQSIIPAGLEGGMKSESWREQSLFLVDFDGDGGVSLAEARERYEDAGLLPAFAYYTFSHSDACEKFRLAFVTDDAICNGSVRDKIMATLIALSGGADAKCIDRARYFNGGNQGGEYYGDTLEVSDVLSMWDDSYSSLLPSKVARKKSDVVKNGRRSYEVEVSGNIIPFATWHWRINARHSLAMLNRFFELRRWVEGDHRERFAFVYYNLTKLIYEAEEALALVQEKVGQMEEPLSKAELYWAINHTEEHEETNMPELHGDGVFLFRRETIAGEDWLDMTVEEAESCGIFRTRKKNARADRNRDVKRERNELVASLSQAGKTPKEIKEVLDEKYGELSLSIRSIQRLCARSKEGCDIIPLTIKINTPSLSHPIQATEASSNGGCKIVPIPTLTPLPTLNPAQERLLDAILNGNRNILLSGVAGSGKSYILKMAIERLEASGKSVAVSAATGMAASHFTFASTFHRLFHMDPDGLIYKEKEAIAELAGYDMVIVDEASMIKASHMDSAINLLRETRERYHKAPRLVLSFDILQLPPVDGGYFFEARNFNYLHFERHYLMENMRQTENVGFTRALNYIRVGENIASCCRYLNAMCSHVEDRDAVYLYAKRWKADAKNREILRSLPGEEIDLGNLVAKVRCEVLITENSRHGNINQYYNGQRGVLEQVQKERVGVRTRDRQLLWLYKKYLCDSEGHMIFGDDGQPLRGYPLSLAYAVTIHKSQGMTLDSANIDPGCFADGQLYVALSRVRSLGGIHLLRNLREQDCKVSDSALAFDSWMRSESSRVAV